MTSDKGKPLLDSVAFIVEKTFGESSRAVFTELVRIGREVQDEELAALCKIHVNEVRRILYRLSEHGFVSFRRIRDRDTGYYVYFWRANTEFLTQAIIARKKAVTEKLLERLRYEESYTYACTSCGDAGERYTFDEALSNDFKCPRCGSVMSPVENSHTLARMREVIERIGKSVEEDERRLYNSRSR